MGSRRLTIGSEKKNNQSSSSALNPNYDFTRTPGNPNRMQMSQNSIQPAPPATSIWGDNSNSDPWGTNTVSNPLSELEDDPLSLSHLGINLASSEFQFFLLISMLIKQF